MTSLGRVFADNSGQAVVEAAFALPVMMLLMLMLIQPAIVFYDRMVMQAAAAEGCRLLTTARPEEAEACKAYVLRRLGAVPQQDCFHIHDSGCTWDVELTGDSSSSEVAVRVTNEISLLPLINAGSALLGIGDGEGHMCIEVEARMPTQPSWVSSSSVGYGASGWVGSWLE